MSNFKRHDPVRAARALADRQVTPAGPESGPSCARCFYALSRRTGQHDIQAKLLCNRFPPSCTTIPGQSGVASLTGFPVVNATMWCHEFKEKADDGELTAAN